ncbi:MAG: ATP-binding protein [Anaerolineae bacterium]|jgi:signal transduction histidine kinase|nr:ATP-binding protein [Anaerolineae bacterium]
MSMPNMPAQHHRIQKTWNYFWQKFTEPIGGLTAQAYRRAHSVISVIFGSFLIVSLSMMYVLLTYDFNKPTIVSTEISLLLLFVMFIAYGISRTKYYEVAVYLYIYIPAVGVVLNLLIQYNIITMNLFLFAPLFGSLLAKPRDIVIVGLICLIFAILFYIAYSIQIMDSDVQVMLITIVMTTAITTFVSILRENNLFELESLNNQLHDQILLTDKARQEAERADRIKSAFLASMSHELRTPLNSIINFTYFVAGGDLGEVNKAQKELLMEVVGSSKHLLGLINDVLDISKIEAGELRLFIEHDINVRTIIYGAITTARSLLNDKPVAINEEISDNLPLIQGDRHRILQILLNILSNACKFTSVGEINVRAYREKDEIIISVADTGPGIAPEDQELVFHPFRQTHIGLMQSGGTGLGMPIARNLAEAHGGRLWLESTFGQGATFYLALPLVAKT